MIKGNDALMNLYTYRIIKLAQSIINQENTMTRHINLKHKKINMIHYTKMHQFLLI